MVSMVSSQGTLFSGHSTSHWSRLISGTRNQHIGQQMIIFWWNNLISRWLVAASTVGVWVTRDGGRRAKHFSLLISLFPLQFDLLCDHHWWNWLIDWWIDFDEAHYHNITFVHCGGLVTDKLIPWGKDTRGDCIYLWMDTVRHFITIVNSNKSFGC